MAKVVYYMRNLEIVYLIEDNSLLLAHQLVTLNVSII